MDRLCVDLIAFLSAVSSSQDGISAAEVELRVRPGDNITLYSNCRTTSEMYTVWFRNCSHEHQPPLVITYYNRLSSHFLNPLPRYTMFWNHYNMSYDLLIENITESDLGLYYCGTIERNMENEQRIEQTNVYHYGHVMRRLSFDARTPDVDCGLCWMLLFSLCPVSALLSCLLSFACFYSFCRTTAPTETQVPLNRTTTRGSDSREQTTVREDSDVCYATVDILQGQRRTTKMKKAQNSDFSTYSAINTSRE
ncbi:uncharacterized protein LOC112240942 isoform X1 [Oncorhynchus tshawytscha]|uniref:uncharacterized protein LOC112240942 isoform X1 n=1 Tax=Oncorhynchus tshawytscha TaxID=74940 RepID=UPI001C3CBB4A|nr:uncharacterized protein LOC112240942 isoform X1 [Oncorhynchus tshawytscha]